MRGIPGMTDRNVDKLQKTHQKNAGIARAKIMTTYKVENVKLSVLGDAFAPDGGTRAPYALFTGKVSIEYLVTMNLPVWIGEARVYKDLKVFGLTLKGYLSGESREFTYTALSNAGGKTLRRTGDPENETDTYHHLPTLMPVGGDYPYPTLYEWNDWEKAAGNRRDSSSEGDWYGLPQVPDHFDGTWVHLQSGYTVSDDLSKVKVVSETTLTLDWCSENMGVGALTGNPFRLFYHPLQGIVRSISTPGGDGWKLLPPVVGMEYAPKSKDRKLVFESTQWLNISTSDPRQVQTVIDLLAQYPRQTASWYAS